jgi:hypothetical protein
MWSIVLGRREPGETYLEAAVRGASDSIRGHRPVLQKFHNFLPQDFALRQVREHILCEVPHVFGWRT